MTADARQLASLATDLTKASKNVQPVASAAVRKTAADIPGLVTLQRELLESALRLVRPGGVVLYATCSPHLSETVSVIREAARRDDVELLDVRDILAEVVGRPVDGLGDGPWVQLWPHRHSTDAMFMAALRRGHDA